MTQTLFVDKSSGTFADQLLAYGLAVVVRDALGRTGGRGSSSVHLSDHGAYYGLDYTPELDDARLAAIQAPYVPAVVIRTRKNAPKLPADLPPQMVVDYEVERDKRAKFFETRKALAKEARAALARRETNHPELEALRGKYPHPDWDVFRAINPAALTGYNTLMIYWWTIQETLPEVLALLRDLFAQTPNDLNAATAAWKKLDRAQGWGIKAERTAAQVYNPGQGKGQNRAKADKLSMGNVGGFWLLEWLKVVGFYHAALTKQLRGVKDRKTYVLAPAEIDLAESGKIMHAFRGRMARAETAIRYTQALLDFTRQEKGASLKARLFQRQRPSRVVSGFYSAFYKNLGNAVATMNLSFIRLPGWLRVAKDAGVERALDVLAEHEAVVRQFDESHSDDHNLLLRYRDFVRQATVTAQYRQQQGDRKYDVRYGLGQQLARKAAYPQKVHHRAGRLFA